MAALIWTFVILLHNFSVSVMESCLQESSLEQFSVAYVFLVVLVFVYNFSIFYSFFLRRPSTQPFDFAANTNSWNFFFVDSFNWNLEFKVLLGLCFLHFSQFYIFSGVLNSLDYYVDQRFLKKK